MDAECDTKGIRNTNKDKHVPYVDEYIICSHSKGKRVRNIITKLFNKCKICNKRCGLTKRIVKCKDCGKAVHLKCLLSKHDHQNKHNFNENNNNNNDENSNSNNQDKKETNNHNDNDDKNKQDSIENSNNDNDEKKNLNSNINSNDKEEENDYNDNDDQNKNNPIVNNNDENSNSNKQNKKETNNYNDNDDKNKQDSIKNSNNDNNEKKNLNSNINSNDKEEENYVNDNSNNKYNISENGTMQKYNCTAVIKSIYQGKDVSKRNDDCENGKIDEEKVPEIINQATRKEEDTNNTKMNKHIKSKGKDHSWSQLENEINIFFQSIPNNCATENNFGQIAKLCGCPLYIRKPLYDACGGGLNKPILLKTFLKFWKSVWSRCKGMPARLIYIFSKSAVTKYLYPDDFRSLVQDVVNTHPGLKNLKKATAYHSLYIKTVISRIFFDLDVLWSGKIDAEEIGNSKLISVLESLESDRHMNNPESYFNYKHFFAIHHYFDRLRDNNNVMIKKSALKRYKNYALNPRIIDSLFFGNVIKCNRSNCKGEEFMSYDEFVWFVMAEEDKSHPRAVEYWFKCMDVDNDGLLNYDDLAFYYEEQIKRLKNKKLTSVNPTMDDLYRFLDAINPKMKRRISLKELKGSRKTTLFIDKLVNVDKYLSSRYNDESNTRNPRSTVEVDNRSDWEKFTQSVYENYAPAKQNTMNNTTKKARRGEVKYKKQRDNKRRRELENNALINTDDIENNAQPITFSNS